MTSISNPPTIMVVETNYLLASAMEVPLSSAGYQVLVATDPDEALALLQRQHVALALIDFRLAHGGPEGLVTILASRSIPFIFCTASTLEEVHEHFPGARVMLKPFGDDQLLSAISKVSAGEGDHGARP